MKTIMFLVSMIWRNILVAKKTTICFACMVLLITVAFAQESEIYDIISTTGSIVDKRSGKPLKVGDKVSFQTELEFSSLQDRAVLLNSEKSKYFLELPKETAISRQMTIASNQALMPVKGRPALITSSRGTIELTKEELLKYFQIDTYTVIGTQFKLPFKKETNRDLVFRYETDDDVVDNVLSNLTISKDDFNLQGISIPECYVMLREGDKDTQIMQFSLFFVDKEQLFGEFDSLLKALDKEKNDNRDTREILRQYCTDVYGMIDRNSLDSTINDYLAL